VALPFDESLQAALGTSYSLEREIGRGGMATVYLARDAKHGRRVALKVLHADLAASLGPERFRREIGFAATLQHPHILTVLDSGETATRQLWFTMPFVEGESLRDRLRRERQLPLDDAVRITRDVAIGLDYAHRQGVVHRDIKPENILLTTDGQALIADFGVARALSATDGESGPLTQTGIAVGTPQYMSPEQAAGERDVGPRSDVYSLGAVLYEMLAGEPPFTGPNAQAVIAKMLSGEAPSIRRARPSVPDWVDSAIRKALATVPADRFASASEFRRAIDPATHATTTAVFAPVDAGVPLRTGVGAGPLSGTTTVPVRTTARRFPVAALALILGLIIGGGALFAWRSHGGPAASGTGGAVRIAVLPFSNLGDTSRAYFADGLTDALRGKLAIVPNVEVIASGSSGQYRNSAKPEDQIGRELGVQYLLIGHVRWANDRVQVSPELVQIADGKRATTKWEQQYDTTITDVFGVQSSIAGQVAKSLGTTLGTDDRAALDAKPTQNAAAYDAYLRGLALMPRLNGSRLALDQQAIDDFKLAVALDSTFARAWALLGTAESIKDEGVANSALKAQARADIDHALALQPNLARGHFALAFYYFNLEFDDSRGHEEMVRARRADSNDVVILGSAAFDDMRHGQPDVAIRELQRALTLDPRSVRTISTLAQVLASTGRYGESEAAAEHGLTIDSTSTGLYYALWLAKLNRQDYAGALAVATRALRLAPDVIPVTVRRLESSLVVGDLDGARAGLKALPPGVDPQAANAYATVGDDLYFTVDDQTLRAFMAMPAEQFIALAGRGTLRRDWSLLQAHVAALHGDMVAARAWGDTAVRDCEIAAEETPKDGQSHYLLGVALAYAGRADEAKREMRLGLAMDSTVNAYVPLSLGYARTQRARVYMLLHEPDSAVMALDQVLRTRGYFMTPAWLRVDPTWTPLRTNAAFQRLVNSDKPIA
jgi:serine/threonine-protein kinase